MLYYFIVSTTEQIQYSFTGNRPIAFMQNTSKKEREREREREYVGHRSLVWTCNPFAEMYTNS